MKDRMHVPVMRIAMPLLRSLGTSACYKHTAPNGAWTEAGRVLQRQDASDPYKVQRARAHSAFRRGRNYALTVVRSATHAGKAILSAMSRVD